MGICIFSLSKALLPSVLAVLCPLYYYRQSHPLNLLFLGLYTVALSLMVGVVCVFTEGSLSCSLQFFNLFQSYLCNLQSSDRKWTVKIVKDVLIMCVVWLVLNRKSCIRSTHINCSCCAFPNCIHILGGKERLWLQLPRPYAFCCTYDPHSILFYSGDLVFCLYPSSSVISQVISSKLDNIVSSWLCARYFSHLDIFPQLSMELLPQLYSACTSCMILTTWSSDTTMMNTYGRLWLSTWIFWTFSSHC